MLFKRKIYSELQAFKDSYGGKKALMIEGARRVGKTTVIKEFVKNEYRSYILIDFSYPSKNISAFSKISTVWTISFLNCNG